jgi:hypothetical protein
MVFADREDAGMGAVGRKRGAGPQPRGGAGRSIAGRARGRDDPQADPVQARAAYQIVRMHGAARVVLAVPVAA